MSRDLRALLDAVDLEALADQLVGEHRGHGRSARWPSPVPGHPQTGRTPPMSIFTDRTGIQRWSCWATGTSGTAIDLVATVHRCDVAAAIEWLATRHSVEQSPLRRRPPPPVAPAEPSKALHDYVTACHNLLWSPAGQPARRWLREQRALPDAVLTANLVGFDPGSATLHRAHGLPYRGPGITLPSFDGAGALVYTQLRYLNPDRAGRKYDNPTAAHGAKPPLSWTRNPAGSHAYGPLVICEGTLDALTITAAGVPAVAIIAAGDARRAADTIATIDKPIVIAVDNDPAGHNACQLLATRLADAGRDVRHVVVPGDLNDLAQRSGDRFPSILRATLRGARQRRPARQAPGR